MRSKAQLERERERERPAVVARKGSPGKNRIGSVFGCCVNKVYI